MSTIFTSAVLQGLNAVGRWDGLLKSIGPVLDPEPSDYIAEQVGCTPLVMQRTLHKLARAGIITVKRGPGGGFRITEEQLRTKSVKDVLEALGQRVVAPEGSRASDRLQQTVHDVLDVTLEEFFA